MAISATGWLWYCRARLGIRAAAALACTVVLTPYLWMYDTLLLVAAAAFLLHDGLTRGFLPGDRAVICVAWILPTGGLLHSVLSTANGFAPAAALLLLALSMRRWLAPPPGAMSRPSLTS